MSGKARKFINYNCHFKMLAALFVVLIFTVAPAAWPADHSMDGMPDMPGMDHHHMKMPGGPEDPAVVAARLAQKHESELNHRLAGVILVLAGAAVFFEDPLAKRWPVARYVWPMCFLAGGIFLLVYSDPGMWPFGKQSVWDGLTHDTEVLQHKLFSLVLLILGYVEFERARGRLTAMWTGFVFPIVAGAGALLLLFHVHGGDMTAPGAMETMEHIEREHGWFAATGFGIAFAKGLSVLPLKWQPQLRKVWPMLLIVLGCLLVAYTE